jgi:hypothetical protein
MSLPPYHCFAVSELGLPVPASRKHLIGAGSIEPWAWAVKLRDNSYIGDFRRWKRPDTYRKALEWLLRDLKVEQADRLRCKALPPEKPDNRAGDSGPAHPPS